MVLDLSLRAGERFLCEAIRHREHLDCEQLGTLYAALGDEAAFALCEHNKITSIAADALACCGIPALPDRWREAHRAVGERISEYMAELDKVAALLQSQDIPLVALKNSGITRALYRYPGASPMGDIDVLVRKQDFRRAHAILTENGCVMKFRSPLEQENLDLAERGGGVEYSVILPSGEHLWLELQWRPVAGRWIRPDQEPAADILMERSQPIAGSAARLLSPEDNLLQVALHTAKHTYVRAPGFRLHTDVDRIVRSCDIDWDRFVGMVRALQVKTAVFFSLALARDLLGTPVPDAVLEKIAPGRWKIRLMTRWLQRVGLFDPDGRKWGRVGYVFFVALLYDDLEGLKQSVLPNSKTMTEKYGGSGSKQILYLHIKRLVNILFKRTLVKK
jgi:hypothetical protein